MNPNDPYYVPPSGDLLDHEGRPAPPWFDSEAEKASQARTPFDASHLSAPRSQGSHAARDQAEAQETERQRILSAAHERERFAASPHIEPRTLPDLKAGDEVRIDLEFANSTGPVTFQLANGILPPGLALSPSGTLHGQAKWHGCWPALELVATDSADPPNAASVIYRLTAT